MSHPHKAQARASVVSALSARGAGAAEVSREAGVNLSTVRDFLNGTRWPRARTLNRIETYLGWEPGRIENEARGLPMAQQTSTVRPAAEDGDGVLLDIDASALEGLDDDEREEVLTAAKLTALSTARAIRRSRE